MFIIVFTFYDVNVKHFFIPPLPKLRRTSFMLCPLEPHRSGAKEGGDGDIEIASEKFLKAILQV